MKVLTTGIVFAAAFGLATVAHADHLVAPAGLSCDATGDPITLDWDDVTDATKYSVDFRATKTVDDVTTTIEFSFGTGDRTDGGDAADSDLSLTLAELEAAAGVGLGELGGFELFAKVKGLHPGRGQGRQNNPFSPELSCGTILETL